MKYYLNSNTGNVHGYNEEDATQQPYIQMAISNGWEEVIDWPPAQTLEEAKAEKLTAIQSEKVRARDGGVDVGGVLYDTDASARLAYLELGTKLAESPEYTITWKANNTPTYVTMDAALFAQVREAGEAHISAVFAWQATLAAQVEAAQTVEDVDAIEVSYA